MRNASRNGVFLGVSAWCAALALQTSAGAQTPSVEYLAPLSCPDAAAFSTEFSRRLPARDAKTARTSLRVQIQATPGGGYQGHIDFPGLPQGGARQLQSASCGELVQALALVAAVVLKEDAEKKDGEKVDAESSAPAAVAPAVVVAPAPQAAPPSSPIARTEQPPTKLPRPSVGAHWLLSARLGANLETGALPNASVGPRLTLGGEWMFTRNSGVALALSAALPSTQTVSVEQVEATFRFAAVRLESYAAQQLTSWLAAQAGAFFELGRLRGTSNVDPTAEGLSPWRAAGLLARGKLRLFRPFWFHASAGVVLPLTRSSFWVDRQVPAERILLHRVASSGLTAEIGVSVQLP
ncbi:MAG: hypothetical protein ACOY0T_31670 [Myxococcota bacterium]